MDLRERLQAHMRSELATTPVSDLGGVMERGETIRRRRRAVMTAAPAVAVVLGVVGVMASGLWSDAASRNDDIDLVAAGEAALSLSLGDLDWQVEPATLGWAEDTDRGEDTLYALSTAPGVRWQDFPNGDLPKALYVSKDGQDWNATPLGDWRPSGLAASGDLLYLVGTAPGARAGTQTVVVRVSGDGGASFETRELSISAPAGAQLWPDLIVADGGVLALATSRQTADPVSRLPAEALEGAVEPLMVGSGIAVFPQDAILEAHEACFSGDTSGCDEVIEAEATEFFTWEDFGFAPGAVQFGEIVENFAFWSPDGENFEPVDYPFPEGYIDRVTSVEGTAVVSIAGMGPTRVFASDDGREWRQIAADVDAGFVMDVGATGSGVVLATQSPAGSLGLYRADDLDGPWEEIPVAGLLDDFTEDDGQVWPTSAVIDESGVAIHVVLERADQRSGKSFVQLVDPILGRDRAGDGRRVGGEMQTQGLLLVSKDLADWKAVSTSHLGEFVDSLMQAPDGSLIAHGTKHDPNGRTVRLQGIANP